MVRYTGSAMLLADSIEVDATPRMKSENYNHRVDNCMPCLEYLRRQDHDVQGPHGRILTPDRSASTQSLILRASSLAIDTDTSCVTKATVRQEAMLGC